MQGKSKYQPYAKSGLQKLRQQSSLIFALIFLFLLGFFGSFVFSSLWKNPLNKISQGSKISQSKFGSFIGKAVNTPTPIPTPSPTPSPTPRPLTFAEMNALYGPCVHLPVLFYHHIQSSEQATANKQTSLTVYTDIFQKQMQYLKDKGYNTVTMQNLINFFDAGTPVPANGIILTFDDGYQDFYTDAYPILQNLSFRATMFLPTGLVNNPGYLSWDEVGSMNGPIFFANHTWSHANVAVSNAKMQTEISTADSQLSDHGLNIPKIFAYPYGIDSGQAMAYLNQLGYKAAFTTIPGSTLCKKRRFDLPRLRIGNAPLSYYGF